MRRASSAPADGELNSMMTVLRPEDAMQPILPQAVRSAVHQWMTEIRAEEELRDVKVEPRRSALLSGPPGCGKTTLAHHIASRLGMPLVCVHMDRLRSQYVGATGQNIAALFETINGKVDDSILFFDEFDAVAAKRGDDGQASTREANNVVNALLQRIEQYNGVFIAATNRAEALDPAIWRRFGMQLLVPLPGDEERFAIIKYYLDPFTLPDSAMDYLMKQTTGAAPSLLKQLIEGVKRDLVLHKKLGMPGDAISIFNRVLAGVKPHPDYEQPPLWKNSRSLEKVADFTWPPERKAA